MNRRLILLLLLVLFAAAYLVFRYFGSPPAPIQLAFVGALHGEAASRGQAALSGVQLFLQDFNRRGGINGRPVLLNIYDDSYDDNKARSTAEYIASKDNVAVIGHTASATSLAAREIYQRAGIAAITPMATNPHLTRDAPWYFRTVYDDQQQARMLSAYLQRVLRVKNLALVYASSDYGGSLSLALEEQALRHQLSIASKWVFPQPAPQAAIQSLVEDISTANDIDAIILILYPEQAVPFVKALREHGNSSLLVGSDTLAYSHFLKLFQRYPEEQRRPGYYSDNMYFAIPFIRDSSNTEARVFMDQYLHNMGSDVPWPMIYSYDAAAIVVHALQQSFQPHLTLAQQRQGIQAVMQELRHPDDALSGLSGALYFDAHGNVPRSVFIARAHHGEMVSAPRQFQAHDEIAQVVTCGMEIQRIYQLDLKESTFKADFELWFRFNGDLDTRHIVFPDAVTPIVLDEPVVNRIAAPLLPGEPGVRESYRRFTISGEFQFQENPLDLIQGKYTLPIRFHHALRDQQDLLFVVDRWSMNLSGSQTWVEHLRHKRVLANLRQWQLADAGLNQVDLLLNTQGNPDAAQAYAHYSALQASLYLKRSDKFLQQQLHNHLPLLSPYTLLFGLLLFALTWLRQPSLGLLVFRLLFGSALYLAGAKYLFYSVGTLSVQYTQALWLMFQTGWWILPTLWLTSALPFLLWRPIEKRSGEAVPGIAKTFVNLVLYVMAGSGVIYFVFEGSLASLWTASGLITLILGFALRNLILDAFTGLTINIERVLEINQWIDVQHRDRPRYGGKIAALGWRTTRLRTWEDNLVIVPNNVLAEARLTNYSLPTRSSDLIVLIHLRVPLERARRILAAATRIAAQSGNGLLAEPAPHVLVDSENERGVCYKLLVSYDISRIAPYEAKSVVLKHIFKHLQQAGIEPGRPRREVVWQRREYALDWRHYADRKNLLETSQLFQCLTDAESEYLAQHLLIRHFNRGETLIRQGEPGNSMFGLAEGLLSVYVEREEDSLKVSQIQAGSFFGEMSLLTGEPRSATVRADTDVVVYEINRNVLKQLTDQRPEILAIMTQALTERKQLESGVIEAEKHHQQTQEKQQSALLQQVIKLFRD
jgi:branched-chain amino acid transport system substrate-binding protein